MLIQPPVAVLESPLAGLLLHLALSVVGVLTLLHLHKLLQLETGLPFPTELGPVFAQLLYNLKDLGSKAVYSLLQRIVYSAQHQLLFLLQTIPVEVGLLDAALPKVIQSAPEQLALQSGRATSQLRLSAFDLLTPAQFNVEHLRKQFCSGQLQSRQAVEQGVQFLGLCSSSALCSIYQLSACHTAELGQLENSPIPLLGLRTGSTEQFHVPVSHHVLSCSFIGTLVFARSRCQLFCKLSHAPACIFVRLDVSAFRLRKTYLENVREFLVLRLLGLLPLWALGLLLALPPRGGRFVSTFAFHQQSGLNLSSMYQPLTQNQLNSKSRPCRDIPCLVFFIVALLGFLFLQGLQLRRAQLNLLLVPFDNQGQPCGANGAQNYPYLLYDYTKNLSAFFCVDRCPTPQEPSFKCFVNQSHPRICPPTPPVQTFAVIKFCVPKADVSKVLDFPELQRLMNDAVTVLPLVGITVGISMALSIVILLVSRLIMGVLVWSLIILSLLVNAGVCLLSFLLYQGNEAARSFIGWDSLPEILRNPDVMQGIFFLTLAVLIILTLLVLCFCGKVNTSIMVLKASAQFTASRFWALAVPVLSLLLILLVTVFCLSSILWSYSTGSLSRGSYSIPLPNFQPDNEALAAIGLSVVFWVWLILLLFAATQYVFAHMVASWYYDCESCLCADLFKNTGSLAFGSFLCALLLLLKWTVELAVAYNQKFQGQDNAVAKCFGRCAVCCVQLFERCVKFISDQAYIVMAQSGNSFLDSVEEAMGLVASKPILFAVCEFAAWLVSSFIKVLIVAVSALASFVIASKTPSINSQLYESWFPLVLFILASYPCAAAMISLFGYSANSLLLFFLKDRQQLVVSLKCPESLKHFIDQYN